jgi:hypothetical protein
MHGFPIRLQDVIGREVPHRWFTLGAEWPVFQSIDVEQKHALWPHNAVHLGKHRPGPRIIEKMHGDVGHDRVETRICQRQRGGHIRHEEGRAGGALVAA